MSLTYLSPWQGQLKGSHVVLEDFHRSVRQDNHTSYLVAQGSKSECSRMPLWKIQGFLAAEVTVMSGTFYWSSKSASLHQQFTLIALNYCLLEFYRTLYCSHHFAGTVGPEICVEDSCLYQMPFSSKPCPWRTLLTTLYSFAKAELGKATQAYLHPFMDVTINE